MKNKFLNIITVSLATSILLAPAQQAFGLGAESQTNIKETQHVVHDVGSSEGTDSEGTQNQGLKATKIRQSHPTHPVAAASRTTDFSQTSSAEQTVQMSESVGGLFVIFLFISYILVGLQYRKYRVHRAAVLLQQIETLERIWKMKPQER